MPNDQAQDKTEKPTPRRRQKAREEGQVAKSQEMGSFAVLLAGMAGLFVFGGFMYTQISGLMRQVLSSLDVWEMSFGNLVDFSHFLWGKYLGIVTPIWGIVAFAAIAANLVQVGFMLNPKSIKPKLSKLNPITGLKKFVGLKIFVDLFKNVGKMALIGAVTYYTLRQEWPKLPQLGQMEVEEIVLYIVGVSFTLFWRAILVMIILVIIDWSYQKYDHEKKLKMSKQEVKDENKQTEGDPHVKARIRSIQREQSRNRMMAAVPDADVVVTNPTHLAVALAYRAGQADAPEVLAKGANKVAQKIKEIARETNVPVIEDKPLAQALFKSVEVGQMIPADLFEAVAGILAHVYRMKNKHRQILNQSKGRQAG